MVRIIHISDWHNQWSSLPSADVYVCTGDMYDNYPDIISTNHDEYGRPGWTRQVMPEKEIRLQADWLNRKFLSKGKTARKWLGNHDAPIILVRGNHDFIDLAPLFGGDVFEVDRDSSRSVKYCGLKFGGFRGVPSMIHEWSDEMHQADFESIVVGLPSDLDVVVSHAPPRGILDYCGEHYGVREYRRWITNHRYEGRKEPKLYCFGHVHSGFGKIEHDDGNIIFSNASCGKQVLDIEP